MSTQWTSVKHTVVVDAGWSLKQPQKSDKIVCKDNGIPSVDTKRVNMQLIFNSNLHSLLTLWGVEKHGGVVKRCMVEITKHMETRVYRVEFEIL